MAFVPMKCPSCGADISLDDSREFGFCQFCGTKIMNTAIQRLKVELSGEPIRVVNNEYETKMANARNCISIYFSRGPKFVNSHGKNGYDAIIALLNEAELAGGAADYKYFMEYADFYVKANIEGAKTGYRVIYSKDEFVATYGRLMDLAINNAPEGEKDRLQKEKVERSERIRADLSSIKEKRRPIWKLW